VANTERATQTGTTIRKRLSSWKRQRAPSGPAHNVDEFTPDTFDFEFYINFPGTELVCDTMKKMERSQPLHSNFLIGADHFHFPCELPKVVHLRSGQINTIERRCNTYHSIDHVLELNHDCAMHGHCYFVGQVASGHSIADPGNISELCL
jgi:hypothetical protein